MEGTLEAPPIVLRTSRVVMLMMMTACVVLAPLCFWMLTIPEAPLKETVAGLAGVVGCCAGVFLGLAKIVRPDQLVISPGGVRYQSVTQDPFDLCWKDIDAFRLGQGARGMTYVALNLTEEARETRRASWLSRGFLADDFTLPGGWPMEPESLIDLLKRAQARWTR